ncbi:DNA-binding protein, AcrR family, includes nucleoid occlusion protein SlmA [Cupriavidus necator]|uniref:TetR/AcrR family transcriptional regulator n=1 Tax=Cupriavidus necator (strain ATCC 17699 / DSM 428 / KCTC 22496 / NCIMB 10442 / H16 / Stanier 337) TaxID=381666 RepID=Q0KCI4_CUPNH|nr:MULTISPECIES: TetR/AcrR family transcriptional regulator [Cupriavidus]EON21650.1 TetR family transcriptional regulator [Cupriavidus sp. GA3-3]KUE89738.1 TetR family transcriptional regulator [Cupriavidus necator]QCC00188.1 TetR/AcrR family transcriptional regulator [Cupriavidus necator H16]QQB76997.1 TetR/AcrR family transcriptional regulator [Cupriavidus necator]WKA42042.1 TetR/AcrR family transcriptional regulator [Cupriavidus necator]
MARMTTELTPARRYRGAEAEERRAQRRVQLIAAAVQVYGERGYQNATVKAVCEAAGLTERYFYESFANSEALLLASFQTVTHRLLHTLALAGEGAGGEGQQRALAMLRAYFGALRREPRSARVFLVEIRGVSKLVDGALADSLDEFGGLLAQALLPPGRKLDPLLTAGVAGGVVHIALRWITHGYAPEVEVVARTALQLALVLAHEPD